MIVIHLKEFWEECENGSRNWFLAKDAPFSDKTIIETLQSVHTVTNVLAKDPCLAKGGSIFTSVRMMGRRKDSIDHQGE